jgi:hypothetical protein
MGQWENTDGAVANGLAPIAGFDSAKGVITGVPGLSTKGAFATGAFGSGGAGPFYVADNPDTDAWYIKPFWRKTWSPAGATTLFGEYGQYNDQFGAGNNLCLGGGFSATSNIGSFCNAQITNLGGGKSFKNLGQTGGVFITGSEVERWGLGVVQEIDSAAMHVFARWQHQSLDANFVGLSFDDPASCFNSKGKTAGNCDVSKTSLKDSFDDWDLFQVGGIIFF